MPVEFPVFAEQTDGKGILYIYIYIYIERKQEYAYAFFRIKMQRCDQYQRL